MNKKDLSAFRRQFKVDSYQLKLGQLYSVYIKRDNQSALYAEGASFDRLTESEQEIYLSCFKKLLTGAFNSKLFELSFDDSAPEGEGQDLCRELLGSEKEEFVECCNRYITAISGNYSYDSDIVLSFVNGSYRKPAGKKGRKGEEESLDGFDDTSYGFKFVMCSISKADSAKRGICYSAATERFEVSSTLDKTINFLSPADGFVYPAFGDNGADINKLMYYTSKADVRNESLLENVLHCACEPTAKEEKEIFEEILRTVNGTKIKPEIIKNIYEAVNEKIEAAEDEGESITLDSDELKDIFTECGVKNLDAFEDAYQHAADKGFEFKASSLVSGNARSVKIKSGVADISVSLGDLGAVKQVINSKGRKCLQIELGEDAEINGMVLETEN